MDSKLLNIAILLLFLLLLKSVSSYDCNTEIDLNAVDEDGKPRITKINSDSQLAKSDGTEYCWYLLRSSTDQGIQLHFANFNLHKPNCTENKEKSNCCDYMEIGIGFVLGSNTVKLLCGDGKNMQPIYFPNDTIWIRHFPYHNIRTSDYELHALPLTLKYTKLKDSIQTPINKKTDHYPDNIDLEYKIVLPRRYIGIVSFDKLDMEEAGGVCYDYLEISEPNSNNNELNDQPENSTDTGSMTAGRPKGNNTYCGYEKPDEYISKTNRINLRLHTDKTQNGDALNINYRSIQRIFDETHGVIISPSYYGSLINITYEIRAPANHRIEFEIDEFNFTPCETQDIEEIVTEPNQVCQKYNDYLKFTNEKGALNDVFFNAINEQSNSSITFCNCNEPVPLHRLVSTSNYVNIQLFIRKVDKNTKADFRIAYKFLPSLYNTTQIIRVLQYSKLSYIDGHMLHIQVPPNHNLRIYGTSVTCKIPDRSIILVKKKTFFDVKYLQTSINGSSNKDCDYLFDINEPMGNLNASRWHVSWVVNMYDISQTYDFEINWKYIKNRISDDDGSIEFPSQKGFNISNELQLSFVTTSVRNYIIQFQAKIEDNSTTKPLREFLGDETYVKWKPSSLDNYQMLHINYFEKQNTYIQTESDEVFFKVKRNNTLSFKFTYTLQKYYGDCNFDESLCDYTKENDLNYKMEHRPKYEWKTNPEEKEDYYLSIRKPMGSDVKRATVFSRFVANKNNTIYTDKSFNKKIFSLSFSFAVSRESDRLEVFLHSNRSDMIYSTDTTKTQLIKRFSTREGLLLPNRESECPSSKAQLLNEWYKISNVLLYSCYDFRVGFVAMYGIDSNFKSGVSEVGIDNVNIDYKNDVAECDENPCSVHGTCVKFLGNTICCCDAGYEGQNCENKIKICSHNPNSNETNDDENIKHSPVVYCQNNGTCVDSNDSYDYKCTCPVGYTGKNCETEINECESNPCMHGGSCVDKIGFYECVCHIGFKGQRCEIAEGGCEKCQKGSCYVIGKTEVKCVCDSGFTGENCDININECLSNPCYNINATCVDGDNDFRCTCPIGYTGKFCEITINYCEEYPNDICKNGGACVSVERGIECRCQPGYFGKNCEKETNECLPNPCNAGVCIDKVLGYRCQCPKGKTGINCETQLENPCSGHKCKYGVCVPTLNKSYECKCNLLYGGEFCDELKICNKTMYGTICNPIGTLEIAEHSGNCLCKCRFGYSGDRCEFKEDLCQLRDVECENEGTCVDRGDEVECICKAGYSGERCEKQVDHCQNKPCDHGMCINKGTTYECVCSQGWKGYNCTEPLKKCSLKDENNRCVKENTKQTMSFSSNSDCLCICKNGFTGLNCEINIDDCAASKVVCRNNGTCVDLVQTYKCSCQSGYTGAHCETKLTGCATRPCKYGYCEDLLPGLVKCHCDKGFTGDFCDVKIDNCKPNPCNGGICHDYVDGYVCQCPAELGQSSNCDERLVDPCVLMPCLNGGTCTGLTKTSNYGDKLQYIGYNCQCPSMYAGQSCEISLSPCLSSPCQNFGTCKDKKDGGYTCSCFPSFTGSNCESSYDPCADKNMKACLNGGTCYPTRDGYRCVCEDDYEGTKCEKLRNKCERFQCMNNGVCEVKNGIPTCNCPSQRYFGVRCENDMHKLLTREADVTMLSELSMEPDCSILGNDSTFLFEILVALIIFFIIVIIIVAVYIYVRYTISKLKRQAKLELLDNSISLSPIDVNNNTPKPNTRVSLR